MSQSKQGFASKHAADAKPDPQIAEAVRQRGKDDRLACALAFDIAAQLNKEPSAVGRTLDLMGWRLQKCQLGLFGYQPQKKIVKARPPMDEALAAHLMAACVDGALPCKAAWSAGETFGLSKMAVAGACEALQIKIKPCQLGAF